MQLTCLVLGLTVCQTESSWRRTMSSKLLNRPCSRVSWLVSILLDLRSSLTQESIRSDMASYIALMSGLRCSHISTNYIKKSLCMSYLILNQQLAPDTNATVQHLYVCRSCNCAGVQTQVFMQAWQVCHTSHSCFSRESLTAP